MASSLQKAPSLPSWCPDLSSERKESTPYSFSTGFRAGFHDWSSRRSTIKTFSDNNSINISGFRVDVVSQVCGSCYTSYPEDKTQHGATATKNLDWDAICLALFHTAFPQRGNDEFEAYTRTLIANHFDPSAPVPVTYAHTQRDYRNLKQLWAKLSQNSGTSMQTFAAKQAKIRYSKAIALQRSRKFMITDGRRIGLGPSDIRAGDVICVFYSAAPLFVLRFGEKVDDKWMLVGDAFVHGLMDMEKMPHGLKKGDERFLRRIRGQIDGFRISSDHDDLVIDGEHSPDHNYVEKWSKQRVGSKD
ncbi:MAG: hypothetical protein Q9203_004263 [Teloschistes exilis]